MHVHHLEDFTTDSTSDAKNNYERHASSCGNTARTFRADNGRFADAAFLEDAHNSKQKIKFCGVGAHHQHGVS